MESNLFYDRFCTILEKYRCKLKCVCIIFHVINMIYYCLRFGVFRFDDNFACIFKSMYEIEF